jgi:hypothetical protein
MDQIDRKLDELLNGSPTGGEGVITLAGVAHRFAYTVQGDAIELRIAAATATEHAP